MSSLFFKDYIIENNMVIHFINQECTTFYQKC